MLNVNEIFYSIQGESTFTGLPSVFIRLTGCNLRCSYCDTSYAFEEGSELTLDSVLENVLSYECHLVEITGGEPLLQSDTPELARLLIARGMTVLVETNGSQNIDLLPDPVIRIMDIKCPGSGFDKQNDWTNIRRLRPRDEVKFVILNRGDFQWACEVIRRYQLDQKASVLLSPVMDALHPRTLAKWMLNEHMSVRLQLQLHKILWSRKERKR